MAKWQYQSKADPVITTGENVLLDKWWKPASEPRWDVKRYNWLFPYSHIFIEPSMLVSVDEWYVQSEEYPEVDPNIATLVPGYFYYTEPIVVVEMITLDKWFVRTAEPVQTPKQHNYVYPYFYIDPQILTQAENILIDKWFQAASEPVRQKQNINWTYPYYTYDSTMHQVVIYNPATQTFKPIYLDVMWGKEDKRWTYPYASFVEQIGCTPLWGPAHISSDIIFLLPNGKLAKRLTDTVYLEM